MRKRTGLFQKLLAAMRDPRYEKPLMIALPCVSLLLAAVILIPQIRTVARHAALSGETASEEPTPAIVSSVDVLAPYTASPAAETGAPVQYVPIENIDEIVQIVDVTQMSPEELKPGDTETAPEAAVAEVINSAEEAAPGTLIQIEEPVRDEQGNRLYRYYFNVGPNGFLLFRESREESDVLPVDEDGDGIPEYGLREVSGEDPDENGQPQTVRVELFHRDNTPVQTYDIIASPITTTVTVPAGWLHRDGCSYYYEADGTMAVGLKLIDGRICYFNENGVRASAVGIDVSFYNEGIDWAAVKAYGIDFAIIRVGGRGWSSGMLYDDIRTQEYLRGARAAGLKVGVYFYSTAVNAYEAVQEASVAIRTVGGISLDYPIFIDMEHSGDYPDGRSDMLTGAERAQIVTAFCETVRASGYAAGVYSGQNFFKYSIDFNAISQYTVWLASYTSENRLPNFSGRYDIWQFTDRGNIRGISGGVDMNVIF